MSPIFFLFCFLLLFHPKGSENEQNPKTKKRRPKLTDIEKTTPCDGIARCFKKSIQFQSIGGENFCE